MSAAQGSVRSGAAVGALLHLGGPLLKSKSSELTELLRQRQLLHPLRVRSCKHPGITNDLGEQRAQRSTLS
jgi:hypothetical protein